MLELDTLDKKLMWALDLDARAPATQLARQLKQSKETINFRIKRLLERGALKGFYTAFNTSKLGWFYYKLYLKFRNTTPQKEQEIITYITRQEHVAYLASMEGRYDCVLLVMARSAAGLRDFLHPFMKKYGDFVQGHDLVTLLSVHRLNNKFLYDGGKNADWNYEAELGDYRLDDIDSRIVRAIASHARKPITDIAKEAGVEPAVARYRLRRLERDHIILAYVSAPGFDCLGLRFVQLNISLKDPTASRSIISYFEMTNRCLFAIELIGQYDLTIEVHVRDDPELRVILDGFRERFAQALNDCDVSTITREHVVVWGPFFSEKKGSPTRPSTEALNTPKNRINIVQP